MSRHLLKRSVTLLLTLSCALLAAPPLWQGQGRIAISSDGNEHDKDDWGATALTLAILSHAGLQNRLVSYTFSDHIWSSQDASWEAAMRESALGGARRFGYDTTRFLETVKNRQKAFERVRDAIDASSATNPLFLICAGPMEVCWQGANMANLQKRAFVTAISHSTWNDKHAKTDHGGHDWNDLGDLGINLVHIKDQNAGFNTSQNWAPWSFLKNSTDANLRWVYSRGEAEGKADFSDAGMAWFLLKGDEDGNTTKLASFFSRPTTAVENRTRSLGEGPLLVVDLRGRVLGTFVDEATLAVGIRSLPAGTPWIVKGVDGAIRCHGLTH